MDGMDDGDDHDDACLRFTKTIQILQERMGDRFRERETNVELV